MPHRRKYLIRHLNHLRRVEEVQAFVLEKQHEGQSMAFVYREHVRARFHISLKTLYRYMSVPVRREIRRTEERIASLSPTPQL